MDMPMVGRVCRDCPESFLGFPQSVRCHYCRTARKKVTARAANQRLSERRNSPENKEKWLAQKRASHHRTKGPRRAHLLRKNHLWYKFGMSMDEYDAMLDGQGGVCDICKCPPKNNKLAVDHNHETGVVRGLICVGCNHMVGRIEKNPWLHDACIEYLERYAKGRLTLCS